MIHSDTNIIKGSEFLRLRPIVAILSVCTALGLLAWALYSYQPAANFYGPRAIYSLLILSILLALLGRILLLRLLNLERTVSDTLGNRARTTWRLLFLFDITAPLYLAAGVLIGPPAAVLIALIIQIALQGLTLWRGYVSWTEACYRIASTALLALISSVVYSWIAGPPQNYFVDHLEPITESKEFLGSILAATVMMLLLIVVSLPIIAQTSRSGFKAAWQEYWRSSVPRFQLLVLSVGPLLPVVDVFDNLGGELAWFFFLVPLFAIYYLALISTRLSIRTD